MCVTHWSCCRALANERAVHTACTGCHKNVVRAVISFTYIYHYPHFEFKIPLPAAAKAAEPAPCRHSTQVHAGQVEAARAAITHKQLAALATDHTLIIVAAAAVVRTRACAPATAAAAAIAVAKHSPQSTPACAWACRSCAALPGVRHWSRYGPAACALLLQR